MSSRLLLIATVGITRLAGESLPVAPATRLVLGSEAVVRNNWSATPHLLNEPTFRSPYSGTLGTGSLSPTAPTQPAPTPLKLAFRSTGRRPCFGYPTDRFCSTGGGDLVSTWWPLASSHNTKGHSRMSANRLNANEPKFSRSQTPD